MLTKKKSGYSDIVLKGTIGYNNQTKWPAIAMERARSDKPTTPVLCEVWGYEHECGSMYRSEFTPTDDFAAWRLEIDVLGFDYNERYFKGKLLNSMGETLI